jgi:hypothetical protein
MADKTVQEALERFKEAYEYESEFRECVKEDLDFLAGNQWPESVKAARERDVENGPRPCLVMDKLNQYVRQVVNDARQNRPAIKVRAVEDGDSDVANIIQGLTRNIEDVSRADIAYDRGIEGSASVGRGWFRVNTEYVRADSSSQDIRILSLPDPLSVIPDCDYREPDGSDMKYCFVIQDLPKARYERMFPKAKASDFQIVDGWVSDNHVRIAEYFHVYEEAKKLLRLQSGHEMFEDDYEEMKTEYGDSAPEFHDSRDVGLPRVKWCKMNAFEILEETQWLGRWVPIIPVHGNEIWQDGKRLLFGMVRQAKDAMRLYNYSRSAYAELIALAPKAPFILAEGQIEGYESDWARANRVNLSYLPYKPVDVAGHQVPPPQRQPFAGVPAGLLQDMVQAEHDIQSSLGMYAPSVGQPSNERSGKAILARQREGDVGNFHYRDNLARSIRHTGRILIDLIPKIYDTRRVLRIIGEDGVESQVIIDPRTQQPVTEVKLLSGGVRKIYNPGIGEYDVTISTGPGYATKREEAANAILQLTQAAPQLFGVVGDLLVKSMDWPYADEIARRLRLMLPPALKPEEDGKKPLPPEAQMKITQLTQALQMVTAKAQEMQGEYAKLKGIVDGKVIDQKIKAEDARVELEKLDVEREKLDVERSNIALERAKLVGEVEARNAEALEKVAPIMKQESDFSEVVQVMQQGFGQVVDGLGQMQAAMQALGQGMQALGQKMDQHAMGAQEHVVRVLADGEGRSLRAIQSMIEGAQTVAVVPDFDDDGNVVGGTALQRDGRKRTVNVGKGT